MLDTVLCPRCHTWMPAPPLNALTQIRIICRACWDVISFTNYVKYQQRGGKAPCAPVEGQ